MTTSQDGSTAHYRAATPVNPHQVRSLSVEWATAVDAGFSSIEKAQLLSTLESAIAREAGALPPVVEGRPVIIRAVVTRVESVSPVLNAVAAVLLTVPLDRGGAAVETEVLDAETLQPLASVAYAHFADLALKLAKAFRWRPHGPVMGYFRDNAVLDYFSGGFDQPGEGLLLVHGSISRSLATSFLERMQRVAQDFAQQHLADQRLPDKDREGYTLLLGMRSWEFAAFAAMRR